MTNGILAQVVQCHIFSLDILNGRVMSIMIGMFMLEVDEVDECLWF